MIMTCPHFDCCILMFNYYFYYCKTFFVRIDIKEKVNFSIKDSEHLMKGKVERI